MAHIAGEMFKRMAGDRDDGMCPIAVRRRLVTDLIGGQVQVAFDPMTGSIEYIRTGTLRALAVTTATAQKCCPTCRPWPNSYRATRPAGGMVSARPRTRPLRPSKAQPGDQRRPRRFQDEGALADLGGTALAGSPAEFGRLIADETEKWAKVVRFARIKPQ